jgi:hypothetical protein
LETSQLCRQFRDPTMQDLDALGREKRVRTIFQPMNQSCSWSEPAAEPGIGVQLDVGRNHQALAAESAAAHHTRTAARARKEGQNDFPADESVV